MSLTSRQILFQGEPAIVTTSVDLTALRAAQAEAARSREALHQSEKLTALGALLAGVAHELNNPLSVVVGYSSMLSEIGCDPAMAARAEKIHAAAERCARIVRTFLAMARARPPQREPVALCEVVMGALDLAGYGLRSADVEVETELPARLPPVHGDADQLHQVVVNLVVNAQQALIARPSPRRLTVRAWTEGGEAVLEVARQRAGDGAGRGEPRLRALLHHQAAGGGHRGRALGLPRHRRGARRADRARHRPRARARASGCTCRCRRRPRRSGRRRRCRAAGGGRVLVVDDEPEIAALLKERLGAGRADGRHRLERAAGAGGARGRAASTRW